MTTALITGASRGIGEQLARALARSISDLILVARGHARLETLAAELTRKHAVRVHVWPEDLSRPDAADRIAQRLRDAQLTLDVLVNNAGVGTSGAFADSDPAEQERMIVLNVLALTRVTRALLPHLIASKRGAILNIASTAGLQPVPHLAVYAATKAFVLSFSQALRNELADVGVTVTTLCPGPTRTDFIALAGAEGSKLFAPARLLAADRVARAGLAGLARRRALVIPGFLNVCLAFAGRFTPQFVLVRISRWLMRPA
jgi:uncharacterized protein